MKFLSEKSIYAGQGSMLHKYVVKKKCLATAIIPSCSGILHSCYINCSRVLRIFCTCIMPCSIKLTHSHSWSFKLVNWSVEEQKFANHPRFEALHKNSRSDRPVKKKKPPGPGVGRRTGRGLKVWGPLRPKYPPVSANGPQGKKPQVRGCRTLVPSGTGRQGSPGPGDGLGTHFDPTRLKWGPQGRFDVFEKKIPRNFQSSRKKSKKSVIPSKKSVIPSKKSVIPSKKSVIPSKKSVIPSKKSVIPGKKSVIQSKKSVIPTKKKRSLLHKYVVKKKSLIPSYSKSSILHGCYIFWSHERRVFCVEFAVSIYAGQPNVTQKEVHARLPNQVWANQSKNSTGSGFQPEEDQQPAENSRSDRPVGKKKPPGPGVGRRTGRGLKVWGPLRPKYPPVSANGPHGKTSG